MNKTTQGLEIFTARRQCLQSLTLLFPVGWSIWTEPNRPVWPIKRTRQTRGQARSDRLKEQL